MPQKRILTKKGVVPNPTVVSQPVNSIPEVVPASSTRVTRIPIPQGTKVPVAAVKPSTQQHKPATTTVANTTAITAATNNIVTETVSSDASLITSSTGSLADWAIDFQVQLRAMNSRFASYETRLNEVERLTAENSQLKLALSDAHQLIATLQAEVKQLSSVPQDTVMSDVSGSSSGAVFGVCSGAPGGTSGDSGDSSGVSVGVSGAVFASGNSGSASGNSGSASVFAGNSSVSKYASLPATSAAKSAALTPSVAVKTSFLDAAKRAPKTKTKSKSKPSAKKVEAAVRFFSDYPEEYVQGYRYLYFRSRHRKSFKEVREQLHTLKIQNWRVLDIHYPAPMAVALLVHHEYAKELLDTLGKAGVTPLADFDPRDPNILEDPRLVSLTEAERVDKVIEVHQGRLLRGLKYLYQHAGRRPISIAVATDFFHKEWISDAQLHEFKSTGTFTIGASDGSGSFGSSGSGASGASGASGSGSAGSPGSGGVFETENVDMPDADTTIASVSLPGGDKPEISQ